MHHAGTRLGRSRGEASGIVTGGCLEGRQDMAPSHETNHKEVVLDIGFVAGGRTRGEFREANWSSLRSTGTDTARDLNRC